MKNSTGSFAIGALSGAAALALLAMFLGTTATGEQGAGQGAGRQPIRPIAPSGSDDAAALAKLDQLVGTWSVQGTAISPSGSSQGPFQGESQFGWTLGGNFLSGDHVLWNSQGAALQTIDVMGFTPGVGFTRSEITNGDRSMFLSSGAYDQATDTISFSTTTRLITADGSPRSLLTSFAFLPDGTVAWNTDFLVGDQSAGSVRLVLTQTSKTPGLSSPQTPFGAPIIQQGGAQQGGAQQGGGDQSGSFIQQSPNGLAVSRAPQTMQENQQLMSAMIKQRQQMQAQMNAMQSQVQDLSRTMSSGLSQ